MQHGVVTSWNDDRGFGFITSTADGTKLFFHISSFSDDGRRPVIGAPVSFTATVNDRGGKAIDVVPITSTRRFKFDLGLFVRFAAAMAIFGFAGGTALAGRVPYIVPGVYIVASGIAFAVYGADNSKARSGSWRVAESTLHLLALLGGWPGALLAQSVFRHKNRKVSFQFAFWLTVALNLVALGLLTSIGAEQAIAWIRQLAELPTPSR